jgi:RHS repeat-associated protein
MVKENPNCGRDSSGKPAARNERGLVTDSPQAAQSKKVLLARNECNEMIEYKDKEGKVILKKALYKAGQYTSTYYIYDDVGNLRTTLPPEACKRLATEYFPTTVTQAQKEAFLKRWAYRYKVDHRQRVIETQLPGTDPVYAVYDLRDRPVMTQDGNQRAKKEWTVTKYDTLNRPVITAIYTHSTVVTQAAMTALVSLSKFCERFSYAGTHGYTSVVFPTTNLKVLTVVYYDNYKFRKLISDSTNYFYTNVGFGVGIEEKNVQGLPTGSKTNIIGSANYLWGVSYYDEKYRPIQMVAQNHLNGRDRTTAQFDFAGRMKKNKTTHTKGVVTKTIARRFVLDHGSRVKETYHTFDTQPEVLLARNEYNEIGQLVTKQTHSRNGGGAFAQNTDYRYNMRGWLKQINDLNTPEVGDLFSMELRYHTPTANGGSAQFNGNISETVWSSAGYDKESYGYYYDSLSRLKEARYFNFASPIKNGRYNEVIGGVNAGGYDLNGNILKLKRYGKKDATTYGLMDNMTYTYTGNQLTRVDDAVVKNALEDGFKETTKVANEYLYDLNGGMNKDLNKDISAITYNILNLARKVYKSGADSIIYTYDASGRKLTQQVYGSTAKKTDYVGEYIYENDAIAFVTHEEGRIVADNSVGAPRPWEYQYFLKDHLGNVRVTFSEKKTTTEHKATLEDATQTAEQNTFKGYKNRSALSIFNRTAGGTYSQVLNGGNNNQIGLAKSFAVNPGDVVDLEVFGKYEAATSTGNSLGTLFTALATTFALSATGGTGVDGQQAYNSFNSLYGAGPIITSSNWESSVAPKAYLNYLLFDQNFVLQDFGFDQIGTNGEQVGVSPVTAADYMSLHVKVKQQGFLYVYVSNKNPTIQNVYFDDLKITYHTGVEQMNSYYAFGLAQNSNGFAKQNLINQPLGYNGKEMQDELNLGWNDYGARMYMSDIGRWGAMDPLAEKSRRWSPYTYAYNNPIRFIDPDGMEGESVTTSEEPKIESDKISIKSSGRTETITQTTVTSSSQTTTVRAGDAKFDRGIASMSKAAGGSPSYGTATTKTSTTTTTNTKIEYDESGAVTFKASNQRISVDETTNINFYDADGSFSGSSETVDQGYSYVENPTVSEKMSSFTNDAINFRAQTGISITNRNDFAEATTRQQQFVNTLDRIDFVGKLSRANFVVDAIKLSAESALRSLEYKNNSCDNCTKSYNIYKTGVFPNGKPGRN